MVGEAGEPVVSWVPWQENEESSIVNSIKDPIITLFINSEQWDYILMKLSISFSVFIHLHAPSHLLSLNFAVSQGSVLLSVALTSLLNSILLTLNTIIDDQSQINSRLAYLSTYLTFSLEYLQDINFLHAYWDFPVQLLRILFGLRIQVNVYKRTWKEVIFWGK